MSLDLSELLDKFKDVSLVDLLAELPSLRDIQHAIDPVPPYSIYLTIGRTREELNKQIKGLLQKGFI